MYSWKTLRTFAAVLLLLPIVHLVFIVSRDTVAQMNSSPEAWADEVEAYTKADRIGALPKAPVILVGGRRIKLWQGLEDLLAPMTVLDRSLGNAITEDITYYYKRLIGYYQPNTVVLLPGDSEFHVRDNKSAEDMVQAIRELVELDMSHGVTQHFYVITPLKTPLHPSDDKKIDDISRQLKAWAAGIDHLEILDANALLTNRRGNAKPDYYRSDGVNLNEHGYVRLSMLLRAQMEQDHPDIY